MTSKTNKPDNKEPQFESTLAQLSSLISTLENDNTSLDQSLLAFEEGVKLTRTAQKILSDADQKVNILVGKNNQLIIQEFSEDDLE